MQGVCTSVTDQLEIGSLRDEGDLLYDIFHENREQ